MNSRTEDVTLNMNGTDHKVSARPEASLLLFKTLSRTILTHSNTFQPYHPV